MGIICSNNGLSPVWHSFFIITWQICRLLHRNVSISQFIKWISNQIGFYVGTTPGYNKTWTTSYRRLNKNIEIWDTFTGVHIYAQGQMTEGRKKTHGEVNQAETNESSHMKGHAPFFNIEISSKWLSGEKNELESISRGVMFVLYECLNLINLKFYMCLDDWCYKWYICLY